MTSYKPRLTAGKQSSKEVFLKKVQVCATIFDYYEEQRDAKGKMERLEAIQDIKEILNDNKNVSQLVLPNLEPVFEMIQKNLFRPLVALKKGGEKIGLSETGVEDEENLIDPTWPHMQGIYDILVKIMISEVIEAKNLKNFVTPSFIHSFLELFNSEEPQERDYCKSILHKLYAKLVPRRKIIRKSINESFLSMIHENRKYNGANELLEIFSSMVSGFAVPLREEHVGFFNNIIIPLHKVHYSNSFHEQLQRCSMLFLNKDPTLSMALVQGVLRYWPFGNSPKETSFISELNEAIEFCDPNQIEELVPSIFSRVVKCMSGPHLQIADKVMLLFENEYFLMLIKNFKIITFPLLVPVIVELSETHWHKVLQESFVSLMSILKEIDSALFDKVANVKDASISSSLFNMYNGYGRAEAEAKWNLLANEAKKIEPGFVQPVIPYVDTHVVGLNNLNGIKLHSNNLIPST